MTTTADPPRRDEEERPRPDWHHFTRWLLVSEELGLSLDASRMAVDEEWLAGRRDSMARAHEEMAALEQGAIANPTEQRQVGHYWLRAPERAPEPALRDAIVRARDRVVAFAADVHERRLGPSRGEAFTDLLVIGIGGSSLGPRLVADALGDPRRDRLRPAFLDNTDPDGIDRELRRLGERLASTLVLVVSKSGSTRETHNGMEMAEGAFREAGLDFARHAVAITGEDSILDRRATEEGWIERFPIWDWVGGRTSLTAPVGLLPAALQGIDVGALLAGAAACDEVTRRRETDRNPAALLALLWLAATEGRAARDMVVLPYCDRLELFSRYLQQLVMESLGKRFDRGGEVVHQGLTVYGNKGSTDQHAYVQQLREGPDDFFVTFLEVLEEVEAGPELEPGVRVGDYLRGFLYGTRDALWQAGRRSLTLTLRRVDPFHLGVLIALYERTVGLYASLVDVNAYDQPGVEAGKKAASGFVELQRRLLDRMAGVDGESGATAEEWATRLGSPDAAESVFQILRSLAANGRCRIEEGAEPGATRFAAGDGE